jgi:hypothetical protein
MLFQLSITKALEYKVKSVPRPGRMEFTCTMEVFDGQEVVDKQACPTPRVTCAKAVADTAWQALMSWNRSRHSDRKNSIYTLYPWRKKDAFKISRVDPQIFGGVMSHSMSLCLDLSDHLLAAQREIHHLRSRLADTKDTLHARQRMQVSQDSDFYSVDQDTWNATSSRVGTGEEPPVHNCLQSSSHPRYASFPEL